MIEITLDNLEQVDEATIQLLVDAKWIEVTREWWHGEHDGFWSVRPRENRKFRKNERRDWNFPCSVWKKCRSAPSVGAKRGNLFVANVFNDFDFDHLVEFRIINKEALR